MENYDVIRNYPEPLPNIHDRYSIVVKSFSQPITTVTVFRHDSHGRTKIAEYKEFSALANLRFEPFAQKQGDAWHDYALICTETNSLSVLDLETGKIVAVEQGTAAAEEVAALSDGEFREGSIIPRDSYFPTSSYVPSWWDNFDDSVLPRNLTRSVPPNDPLAEEMIRVFNEDMRMFEGQWGLYAGKALGSAERQHLRYIDLSRVSEGIITTDSRFGYLEVPSTGNLKTYIELRPSTNQVYVSTPVLLNLSIPEQ